MPELPDIELYLHALRQRIVGRRLHRVRLASSFLVRSVEPPIADVDGNVVRGLRRLGKRVVWEMEDGLFLVFHLMIAGRFRWTVNGADDPACPERRGTTCSAESKGVTDDTGSVDHRRRQTSLAKVPAKIGLAAFDFANGTVLLTEAGSSRQASLHLVRGEAALAGHDPGGIDVLTSSIDDFAIVLSSQNHTLKRALTDPHLFSGIGNAYSDEILLAARLSPVQLTSRLSDAEIARLHAATKDTLTRWRDALIAEAGDEFPKKVTAFREGMAAHGRYGKPCPVCGTPVQRIRYSANEANYCPTCQTGGKLLADRGLSRLLKDDWPRSLDDLERYKSDRRH